MTDSGYAGSITNSAHQTVVSAEGDDLKIGLADARLIIAVPELLEALQGLLTKYCSLVKSGDAGFWNPETEVEVKTARAALAKAKGD
jgi:hypothetical protein